MHSCGKRSRSRSLPRHDDGTEGAGGGSPVGTGGGSGVADSAVDGGRAGIGGAPPAPQPTANTAASLLAPTARAREPITGTYWVHWGGANGRVPRAAADDVCSARVTSKKG